METSLTKSFSQYRNQVVRFDTQSDNGDNKHVVLSKRSNPVSSTISRNTDTRIAGNF